MLNTSFGKVILTLNDTYLIYVLNKMVQILYRNLYCMK